MALVARIEENIQLVLLPLPYPQIQREPKREKERDFFPNAVCVYFCNKSKQKKMVSKKNNNEIPWLLAAAASTAVRSASHGFPYDLLNTK